MKKRILCTLIAALMIISCFAGCKQSEPADPLIGKWSSEFGLELTFEQAGSSGTAKFALGNGTNSADGVYIKDGDTLTLIYADGTTEELTYSVSEGTLLINGMLEFTKSGVTAGALGGGQILTYSVIGFLTVFAVLLILFVAITIQGKIFDSMNRKEDAGIAAQSENTDAPKSCCDEVMLTDVDEESAAMIMAIVADETGIPMEELYFKSIELVKGEDAQ